MAPLPSDFELHKKVSAGWTTQQIADFYGSTRQGVEYRLHKMDVRKKGPKSPVTSLIPWNLVEHPEKRSLTSQAPFRGLRYFLQKRMGETLTERAAKDLNAFLYRVSNGYVLALVDGTGFTYVPRRASDMGLVIRWPEDVPEDERTSLFALDAPAEGVSGT